MSLSPELRNVRDHLITWLQGSREVIQDAVARRESAEVLQERMLERHQRESLAENDMRILMAFLMAATDDAFYQELKPDGREVVDQVLEALGVERQHHGPNWKEEDLN